MCGSRSPASALAPSQDMVRHMPSRSSWPPYGSRRVSSSVGVGERTRSVASRAACSRITGRARGLRRPRGVPGDAGGGSAGRLRRLRRRQRDARGGRRCGSLLPMRPSAGRRASSPERGPARRRPRQGPVVRTSVLAIQPRPSASTKLAAQAAPEPTAPLRLGLGARPPQAIEGGRETGGGARRDSNAVVRSRSAAIPSRVAWQDGQSAR